MLQTSICAKPEFGHRMSLKLCSFCRHVGNNFCFVKGSVLVELLPFCASHKLEKKFVPPYVSLCSRSIPFCARL